MEMAGVADLGAMGLSEADLDGDFDPDKFDAVMAKVCVCVARQAM